MARRQTHAALIQRFSPAAAREKGRISSQKCGEGRGKCEFPLWRRKGTQGQQQKRQRDNVRILFCCVDVPFVLL